MTLQELVYILTIIFVIVWLGIGITLVILVVIIKKKLDNLSDAFGFLNHPSARPILALSPLIPLVFKFISSLRKRRSA